MPSLSDTLNNKKKSLVRGPDGQLTEQTPEEVQSLSAKAGLSSPPITPVGVGMIGGNPHQQKMAGTPNQKAAALTIAQNQPGQSLADAVRQGQGNDRSQASGSEAAGMAKSQELQALGGLGDRVGKFIDAQRAKLTAAQPVEVEAATQFNGKDVSQIKPLLAQLRANPSDMSLQLQVNQALGYDAKQQLAPEQINQLYDSAVNSIAKGGAGNVDNDLTVQDLIAQGDFGYDAAELAHLLNIPEDQAANLTIGQIRNKVAEVQANEFSGTNQLEQQAQSGQLGSAERALARGAAREASRTGVHSSEADVQALEQQITAADNVSFGGKLYTVEDLLKDDTISGVISDYLNSAPGSPARKQLEASEPQLLQFIQKNEALLHDASQALSTGAQQFSDVQSYNKSITQSLPENLRNLVAPEANSLQSGKIDIASKPLLQWAQQNPQGAQALAGVSDDDARALSQLDGDTLNKLQIGQPGGKWDQYVQDKQKVTDLQNRAAQATSPEDIMNLVFGGANPYGDNVGALNKAYQTQLKLQSLGMPNNVKDFKYLDADGDGTVDAPETMKNTFISRTGQYSLQDALTGTKPTNAQMDPPGNAQEQFNEKQNKVFDGLRKALSDGKIDASEIEKSGLTTKELVNNINWDGAVFKDNPEFLQGTVNTSIHEILGPHKLDTVQDMEAAYSDLEKERNSLSALLNSKKGVDQNAVIKDFSPEMDKLAAKIKTIHDNEAATKAAESARLQAVADQINTEMKKRAAEHGPSKSSATPKAVVKDGKVVVTDPIDGRALTSGNSATDDKLSFYLPSTRRKI